MSNYNKKAYLEIKINIMTRIFFLINLWLFKGGLTNMIVGLNKYCQVLD